MVVALEVVRRKSRQLEQQEEEDFRTTLRYSASSSPGDASSTRLWVAVAVSTCGRSSEARHAANFPPPSGSATSLSSFEEVRVHSSGHAHHE